MRYYVPVFVGSVMTGFMLLVAACTVIGIAEYRYGSTARNINTDWVPTECTVQNSKIYKKTYKGSAWRTVFQVQF